MGKVVRKSIRCYGNDSASASEILDEVYGFYSGLDIPLITSVVREGYPGTVSITIDNTVSYFNAMSVSISLGTYLRIGYQGESSIKACGGRGYGTITICYTDTMYYLIMQGNEGQCNTFIYEKIDGKKLCGRYFSNSTSVPFRDISAISIRDLDTNIEYKHGKIIGYDNDLNHIDYLPQDVLIQVSSYSIEDPNFITCTTVTPNALITFGAYNYYSVGNNTIMKLDN